MKYLLLIVLATFTLVATKNAAQTIINDLLDSNESIESLFQLQHSLFKKEYDITSEEATKRLKIFKDNVEFIKQKNAEKNLYKLGINQFTDRSREEYLSMLSPNIEITPQKDFLLYFNQVQNTFLDTNPTPMPHGDWSRNLAPTRAQKNCGACYGIAATQAVEAAYSIKKGIEPVQLSIQQIVDCDNKNKHCVGGYINYALQYIKEKGIERESDYPFVSAESGKEGQCSYNPNKERIYISGYEYCSNYYFMEDIKPCTTELYAGMLQRGPVAVMIDASSPTFNNYHSGIWEPKPEDCLGMNHGIIAVGFGVENGVEYVNVRNSWGDEFGEAGHIKIKYSPNDPTHSCFVTANAYLPII